jgi:Predicted pPIWI-associating nuclease
MEIAPVSLKERVAALGLGLPDKFSSLVIEGALIALKDQNNPLRLNCFSTAMRILYEHTMDRLSPREEVARTSWFKPEAKDGRPTRTQRIKFAIHGGLSEEFVKEELKVGLEPLRKRMVDSIDDLSKHIHSREDTIVLDKKEQDELAAHAVSAMEDFLTAMSECREAVLNPIAEALDGAAVNALLSETIMEVEDLAPHHSVDELYIEDITVEKIGADSITYQVTGSIEVTLQWGSNSDVRNDNGAEARKTFPFRCEFRLPVDDPWELGPAEPKYLVDTSSWRDMMTPEE